MTPDTATAPAAISGDHLPAGAPATDVAEWRPIAAGLATLTARAALANFDLTTAAGLDAARKVRREIVSARTRVEEIRQREKAPILERGRQIDAFAKWLTGELETIERPVDSAIRADEDRKAAVKAERERIERERVATITKRIDWIRGRPADAARCKTSADVLAIAEGLAAAPMTEELYGEQLGVAIDTKAASLAWLHDHARALREREAEAERLAQEREQIEAEKRAERERREREEEERRQEQARQDAERAARIAREDAERQARQRAEDEARAVAARQEEERIAIARAEVEARERAERDERARQEAEARAQREREEAAERERRAAQRKAIEDRADPWGALKAIQDEIEAHCDDGYVIANDAVEVIEVVYELAANAFVARTELEALDAQERGGRGE